MNAIRCPSCGSPFWKKVDVNFQCNNCGIIFEQSNQDTGPVQNNPGAQKVYVTYRSPRRKDLLFSLDMKKQGKNWTDFNVIEVEEILIPMWRFAFRSASNPISGRYVQGEHALYAPAVSWMFQNDWDKAEGLILNDGMPDCIAKSSFIDNYVGGKIVSLEDQGWPVLEPDMEAPEVEPLVIEQADAVRQYLKVGRQVPLKWRAELIFFEFGKVRYRFGLHTRTAFLPLDTSLGELGKLRFGEFSYSNETVPMGGGGTRVRLNICP
jgi:uncharacterized Zn finger protein (UPF0148 family)